MRNQPAGNPRLDTLFGAIACIAALCLPAPVQALTIKLTSTGNASADAAFAAAAGYWQSVFGDQVTVNITAGFASLPSKSVGETSFSYFTAGYEATRQALGADATSADDASFVAGLPSGSYSKYLNGTLDSGGAAHVRSGVSSVAMTSANAKAIGLLAANGTAEDAKISFSSSYGFDFDPSDGIGAGLLDFVGLAIHELAHALGFVSGVDVLDNNYGKKRDDYFDPYATILDFTRCSTASEAAKADMDWTASTSAKNFAIDGKCSALVADAWSTGEIHGDGSQASHWKDARGLGIMDPTAEPAGKQMLVSALDIQALDVIGWNRVPEPSTLLLFGSSLLGMLGTGVWRRRRNAV